MSHNSFVCHFMSYTGGENQSSSLQTQKELSCHSWQTAEKVQGEAGDIIAWFEEEEFREPAGEQSRAGRQGEK